MNRTTILLLLIGSAVLVIGLSRYSPVETDSETPWSVVHTPDNHINAFGIILGKSNLKTALNSFSRQAQNMLLVDSNQNLKLVSLFKGITFDGLIADIELVYDLPQSRLQQLIPQHPPLSSLQKISITDAQLGDLQDAIVSTLIYRPSVDYTEEMVLQRFGYPDIREDTGTLHRWVYKDMHLQIYLDDNGADRLVYTASTPDSIS